MTAAGRHRVIVSTVPASATTTEEHVPDALVLPSPLFSAGAGVVVDMAYKPAETPPLRLVKTVAAGKWHSVMGTEVFLEQGYRQLELWRVSKAILVTYQGSAQARPLVSARVELNAAPSRKKRNDE